MKMNFLHYRMLIGINHPQVKTETVRKMITPFMPSHIAEKKSS